jgi:RNA polymerase sigma-70 factor, ECF subfamily
MPAKPDNPNDPLREFVAEITALQPELRAFVGYLMRGMAGASDLAQESNLVLWEKRDHFVPGTNFRAWAFAVARFVVLGHFRRMRRENQRVFSTELIEQLADEWQDDPYEHERNLLALENCLAKLPEDDLELVRARYGGHGGIERLANKGAGNAGTLRMRLCRLRAALKRCVEKTIEGEGELV